MNKEEFRDAVAELKSRITMPEVLDMYGIKLPRSKKISCLFHEEKTASLHIYEDHCYCYGCGAFGDILEFVSRMEGINKFQAYRWLGGEIRYRTDPFISEARKKMEEKREAARVQEQRRKSLLDEIGKLREQY